MIRWEIHASFLLREHVEIAGKGHLFLVVVKEVRNLRRCRAVSAHELGFLVQSRPAKHQGVWHAELF